ncbi:MAG TPA: peptide-methionine (S)-S-oxide reductase MsrA [Acetobacteraceae bacterium]|nr:peptide-methionine (S)-S-oxide reductase MsrA [Acetobacteraceae bacterium]
MSVSPSSFTRRRSVAATGLALGVLLAAGYLLRGTTSVAETARAIPAPVVDEKAGQAPTEVAVLAGGCFWGVQGVFQHVSGVTNAVSGYAGGDAAAAHYQVVGSGTTGHAESVQITYDPRKVTYGQLLQIYFSVAHDPTQRDRQGPDIGSQYRSAIFPMDAEQARVAKAYIEQLDQAKVFPAAVATRIEPGKTFFAAEGYHQNYLTLHPHNPYIAINDLPKIDDLKRLFPERYRADPALVVTASATN